MFRAFAVADISLFRAKILSFASQKERLRNSKYLRLPRVGFTAAAAAAAASIAAAVAANYNCSDLCCLAAI